MNGKYRLEARLGGGGMAEVYVGETVGAEGFARRVAIKRVLPGFSDNPQFAQMFVDEARISSRLVHPNIVSVLDFDRDADNRLFLVMELVDGKDLDGLIATGMLPLPVIIFVIAEVLRGLGHAHDLPVSTDIRGVVHRDVSPHNVLLSWEGVVKVSDFGIAKARTASDATASVFIKGKPAYMSPEQANGQPLDGRSDLFAVGIMLWEMLTARRLFVGEDTRATLAAVLFGQIPRPRTIRPDIPKDVEKVVMKLLERDLPARYATAEQAVAELLACNDAPKDGRAALMQTLGQRFPHQMPVRQSQLRSRGAAAPTPAPVSNVANAMTVPDTDPRDVPTRSLQPPPSRGPRIALLVLLTLVVAGGSFALVAAITKNTKTTPPQVDARDVDAQVKKPIDAKPDAPPDAPPTDAPPDVPKPIDARKPLPVDAKPVVPPDARGNGLLHVINNPPVIVLLDGQFLGQTPLQPPKPVPAGHHTVTLKNEDAHINMNIPIDVVAGETVDLSMRAKAQ